MLMEESTTYQAILAKGRSQGLSQGLRTTLIRQGTKRFGAPNESVSAELLRISDPSQLEVLSDRILDATSWDDLLAAD